MEEKFVTFSYTEIFIIVWIIFSLLVGLMGYKNKMGFSLALVWSIVFSPIIGLIMVLRYQSVKNIFGNKKKDN
jgi:predicted membrane protein